MTRIETIKLILWGKEQSPYTDTEIKELTDTFGYNGAIYSLAVSEYNAKSAQATAVNDGANSFQFANTLSGLETIIKKAKNKEFSDPESENPKKNTGLKVIEIKGREDRGDFI